MEIIRYPQRETWPKILQRPVFDVESEYETIKRILDDVRLRGDAALRDYTRTFDKVDLEDLTVSEEEFEEAIRGVSVDLKSAIQFAKTNIEKFHRSQIEEIKAVVDEAHGQQRKVACHAYNGIGLQRALDGGCDSIEHGLEITDAQIAQMVKQGTWYCPTLAVYYTDWGPADTAAGQRDRKRAAVHIQSFQKAMKAGVKIVFGTDMGGIPWTEPIAQEFLRMVEFGMSPADAIKSATSRAAEMLDMEGQIGVIAPGAYADVIAVNGDPVRDIKVLENVQFVMKDGNVFKADGKQ